METFPCFRRMGVFINSVYLGSWYWNHVWKIVRVAYGKIRYLTRYIRYVVWRQVKILQGLSAWANIFDVNDLCGRDIPNNVRRERKPPSRRSGSQAWYFGIALTCDVALPYGVPVNLVGDTAERRGPARRKWRARRPGEAVRAGAGAPGAEPRGAGYSRAEQDSVASGAGSGPRVRAPRQRAPAKPPAEAPALLQRRQPTHRMFRGAQPEAQRPRSETFALFFQTLPAGVVGLVSQVTVAHLLLQVAQVAPRLVILQNIHLGVLRVKRGPVSSSLGNRKVSSVTDYCKIPSSCIKLAIQRTNQQKKRQKRKRTYQQVRCGAQREKRVRSLGQRTGHRVQLSDLKQKSLIKNQ